jgi:hypothetical protein
MYTADAALMPPGAPPVSPDLKKAPVMMDHDRGHPIFRGPLGGYLQTRHGDNAEFGLFVLSGN